jgi:putative hemolysin
VDEVRRAQRLRFEVFNLELNEGLAESHFTGLDVDAFDAICDHLIIEEANSGEIVGTYRLQTGERAAANIGYYSEREFDFTPFESFRKQVIELGRACVHAEHRNFTALHLLWRGIASYAHDYHARFLVGCSSLTSQDAGEGYAAFAHLREKFLAKPEWQTLPMPDFRCYPAGPVPAEVKIPKLMRAYLAIGAKICGPPAIDKEFGTIDFLTLLNIQSLPAVVRTHFFR